MVVIDLVAREPNKQPAEHRDYVVELGGGRLADELEAAIPGMSEGEARTVELEINGDLRGEVDVTLKEIKEKTLPELDDELARGASEFETLTELRADIEGRLKEQLEAELDADFREKALDALVEASEVEGVEPLADRRAAALLTSLVRSLESRGITIDAYLRTTGQTPESLQTNARTEAERAVKRELVLEAVAAERELTVSDEEIEELVRTEATQAGEDPDEVLVRLRESGGFEQLRGDLLMRNALDEIAAGVKRIPLELAHAREKLWTPEKEKGGTGMKIWTPGSEEKR
jgi:trigger factor